ncbi:glucose-1-phosphate adenylyltransferase [candidate division KSB3 bacterium]|uniref:Glucose-1-phosphate adenylyltransferase n=1 Tax=candidate division KSB3 bacterium TaxID=2044937 RepID=A0A2G6EF74_9BACT|nr:MAG: glucose-1-phosphate adenylyltransferase [candidate division KSB3 bacterium]
MEKVLSIILGGGKGTRLYPLTADRAKPAVPFGGKARLIDIAISNCINSGFMKIYILTQFESASLNFHVSRSYQFDDFSKGFVEILAARQNMTQDGWYQGTADAVRKNLINFRTHKPDNYMILSGDQLYSMDLQAFLRQHKESGADITIASTPVSRSDANELGILKIDKEQKIESFLEKPGADLDIRDLKIPRGALSPSSREEAEKKEYLASMGIYIFKASVMEECLATDYTDFGKEIIPEAIKNHKVGAYIYRGYWEDIGTIKSFYLANLNLASPQPNFNLYDEERPVYNQRRNLPPSKINSCMFKQSLAAEGSIISDGFISYSIVGVRTIINEGATLDGVFCMGADYYESPEEQAENKKTGIPNIGIGKGAVIKGTIIDKNARIGANCRIGADDIHREDGDYGEYHIIDGIIIIHKHGIIKSGTVI